MVRVLNSTCRGSSDRQEGQNKHQGRNITARFQVIVKGQVKRLGCFDRTIRTSRKEIEGQMTANAQALGAQELFRMTHPGDKISQGIGVVSTAAVALGFYFGTSDSRVLVGA
jgi:uncharacterized protein YbjQ (UPF0145 family)